MKGRAGGGAGPKIRGARDDLVGSPRRVLTLLTLAFILQLAVWLAAAVGLQRVAEAQPDGAARPDRVPLLPLSVVVAAHDEAQALPALLDALAAQAHRPAEVVVVDDRSTDGTARVAESYPDLDVRVVRVEAAASGASGLPPKKYAVTRGVEAASQSRVVLTDADGRPAPTWLETIARHAAPDGLDEGAVLVGYGPYAERAGWLNRFVRYETVQTALWAAAGVGWGRPWQAVGRNLSYPRAVFGAVGGFEGGAASLSGDDDLFVQEVARRRAAPVRYVLDPGAAVFSEAPASQAAFWRQKRRHASAGGHYPAGALIALGAAHVSNLALWLGAPALWFATGSAAGWGLLAAKLIVQLGVVRTFREAVGGEGDLGLALPALDALSAVYHAVFAALGALPAPRRW